LAGWNGACPPPPYIRTKKPHPPASLCHMGACDITTRGAFEILRFETRVACARRVHHARIERAFDAFNAHARCVVFVFDACARVIVCACHACVCVVVCACNACVCVVVCVVCVVCVIMCHVMSFRVLRTCACVCVRVCACCVRVHHDDTHARCIISTMS
jgi:hypothetical protein